MKAVKTERERVVLSWVVHALLIALFLYLLGML
jgi:hypothetical protein